MIARSADRLPDLDHVVILLPDLTAARPLRRHLLAAAEAAGHGALLGPHFAVMRSWVLEQAPLPRPLLGEHARELLVIEALRAHPALLADHDPWLVADSLLRLFDDLAGHSDGLDDDPAHFEQRVRASLGAPAEGLAALSREAGLVHTLWRAWREQLAALGREEIQTHYVRALDGHADWLDPGRLVFAAGFETLLPAEARFLAGLMRAGQGEVVIQADDDAAAAVFDIDGAESPACSPVGELLAQALEPARGPEDAPLAERARRFAATYPQSPLAGRLRVFRALDAEQHAMGIDLAVRQWLLAGKQTIGVVSDDRRLARRVRALLERAGLVLQDSAGWALSTTSAAAVLERWLEAVEEDYACQPLLDVLKSPFVCPAAEREAHLATVHRFEQDVVRHENIARDLDRYRWHVDWRLKRLPAWGEEAGRAVRDLLDRLEEAGAPLRGLLLDDRPRPPRVYLDALEDSLRRLGVWQRFGEDAAGQRIQQELTAMHAELDGHTLAIDWTEFRTWLGRTLESHNFRPALASSPVQLLGLEQTPLTRFDALIVAGADRARLPGTPPAQPFFNDHVRRDLGLPGWAETRDAVKARFRGLLQSADDVLLTYQGEDAGEPLLPSPWLEAIQGFHRLAWGDNLTDATLGRMALRPEAQVRPTGDLPLPGIPTRPAPTVPAALVPDRYSASRHQQLIDCPYRFFAAQCLRLQPPEEISELLSKADYGERVHACLEAFHGGRDGLPGPFGRPLNHANRAEAEALLDAIAQQAFARDTEDNFQHRGWLARWRALIPAYIDWQIRRQTDWQVEQTEVGGERTLADGLVLRGRLDRVDRSPEGRGIIDYKTGGTPRQQDVDQGEAVQLTTYALLLDNVRRVEYLKLDPREGAKVPAALEGEALDDLKDAVAQRLTHLRQAITAGAPLPAWGDPATCSYCEMSGLCRREAWKV